MRQRFKILLYISSSQIRGTRDINIFLEKSEVLLDVKEDELEKIVDRLLDVMMQEKYGELVSREELASLIFANPERTLLSEFVQGTIHKGMNQYEWEQVRDTERDLHCFQYIISLENHVTRVVGITSIHTIRCLTSIR